MFLTPIHHAAIIVSDIERSMRFYRDILGWEVLFRDTLNIQNAAEVLGVPQLDGRMVILQKEKGVVDGMIELIEISRPAPRCSGEGKGFNTTGLRFMAFRVSDVEKVYRSLIEKGVKFLSCPKVLEFSQYSIKSCIFFDPDDVRIEIIEFLDRRKLRC